MFSLLTLVCSPYLKSLFNQIRFSGIIFYTAAANHRLHLLLAANDLLDLFCSPVDKLTQTIFPQGDMKLFSTANEVGNATHVNDERRSSMMQTFWDIAVALTHIEDEHETRSLGMNDSWGSLKALVVAPATNGIGDVVLCLFLGYGIAVVAWATMASQVCAIKMVHHALHILSVVVGFTITESLNHKVYKCIMVIPLFFLFHVQRVIF